MGLSFFLGPKCQSGAVGIRNALQIPVQIGEGILFGSDSGSMMAGGHSQNGTERRKRPRGARGGAIAEGRQGRRPEAPAGGQDARPQGAPMRKGEAGRNDRIT